MPRLFGAQRMVLQAIRDLIKDNTGFVTDDQIAKCTQISITDVRDCIEILEGDGYVEVARTTAGYSALIKAEGRLALNSHVQSSMPSVHAPYDELIEDPRILCICSRQYLEGLVRIAESYDELASESRKSIGHFLGLFGVSGSVIEAPAVSSAGFRQALSEDKYDIIQMGLFVSSVDGSVYFSDVDCETDVVPGPHADCLPAEVVVKLIELSQAKLVVLVACDSLLIASKLSAITNVIASSKYTGIYSVLDWEMAFYDCLSRGLNLKKAFEISDSITLHPVVSFINKDMVFRKK